MRYVKSFGKAVAANIAQKAARSIASSAYSYGKKAYNRFKRSFKKSSGTGAVSTTQAPVVNRGRSGRYRRSDRKFRARVLRAIAGDQQLRTLVRDEYGAIKTTSVGQVTTDALTLGGCNAAALQDDLWKVMQEAYSLTAVTDALEEAIYVRSIVCDFDFTNLDTDRDVLIDLYYVYFRRATNVSTALDAFYNSSLTEVAGTVTTTHIATTPYQNPNFLKHWKIGKHKLLQIKPGESANLQMRLNKRKRVNGKILNTSPQGIPGYTIGLLWQIRGCVESDGGNPTESPRYGAAKIAWKARKTISFFMPTDRATATRKEE